MNHNLGRGWVEMMRIHKGLYVERTNYRLKRQLESSHTNTQTIFTLNILLSGHFELRSHGTTRQTFAAGDLWLLHDPFEQARCTQRSGENTCSVSIGLPQDLIDAWLGSCCCGASKGLETLVRGCSGGRLPWDQTFLGGRNTRLLSGIMRSSEKLLRFNYQTFPDSLHFESLALDLLYHILALDEPSANPCVQRSQKIKTVVDETVDILLREWNNPPTISILARRVGVNECYLKKWFRERMGMSIGDYIRQQRMKKALEMIETGRYSILKTALFVGYSNPGHFSTAFKKFYGQLPSYYLPRLNKTS
ncbi:MAG: hypothetical protein CSA21_06405 [Deltaproteobacteria bacterium]|nr:MAG: hypothetical protein CSA21_06405 [Deltaproteobacteria bacterium]